MSHDHSPAELLRKALVLAGAGVLPDDVPEGSVPVWPIYVGHLPGAPDNAICIYDTSGRRDGRLMKTGESVSKPGWQIRVRATHHTLAVGRMKLIQRKLDTILKKWVSLGGDSYEVSSVTQTGTPLSLGQETEAKRRSSLTLNGTITYKELMT